jgi:hypothetical protein
VVTRDDEPAVREIEPEALAFEFEADRRGATEEATEE